MPGIKISVAMRNALPSSEKKDIEDTLWAKSGGICFLCAKELNKASDDIECDHDTPEAEGGKTEVANLNLVHRSCNRFKRNASSTHVRPYLRFRTFLEKHPHGLRYGECLAHFSVSPLASHIEFRGKEQVTISFPNGTKYATTVLSESRGGITYRSAYVIAPIEAIFNDDAVQPRTVKPNHVYAILTDLGRNPLHEAPACRVHVDTAGSAKLLMFDGQHKTLATWLTGARSIAMKLYFDFTKEHATELVNSIQAKIKKLPLSPFELSAKLSDEWSQKLEAYEREVGELEASEDGFIAWLPQAERARAKGAFKAALTQALISSPDLEFVGHVDRAGSAAQTDKISENAFKTKVLDVMLYQSLLKEKGERMSDLRENEKKNIVRMLNLFSQLALESDGSPQADVRIKRVKYQASLEYIARLLRGAFMHFVSPGDERAFLAATPTDEQWNRISDSVRRLVQHTAWTADFSLPDMRALETALSKNQGAEAAFKAAGLTLGYVVGVA